MNSQDAFKVQGPISQRAYELIVKNYACRFHLEMIWSCHNYVPLMAAQLHMQIGDLIWLSELQLLQW